MNRIQLLTDADIENLANHGRVLNNKNLNLRYIKDVDGTEFSPAVFVSGGLYDPRIFGSVDRCSCGKTKIPGIICPMCGVRVLTQTDYQKSIGYYRMYYPYILDIKVPAFIERLQAHFSVKAKFYKDLWSLAIHIIKLESNEAMQKDKTYVKDSFGTIYEIFFTELPDTQDDPNIDYSMEYYGLMGILQLANFYTLAGESFEWIKAYINYNLVISSPAERMYSSMVRDGQLSFDFPQLNDDYTAIIEFNEMLPELIEYDYTQLVDKMTLCWFMNVMIVESTKHNQMLMPSKQSFIRNVIDTRVKKSLRANLVSSMELKINEMYVPSTLAYKALELDVIMGLVDKIKYANEADCVKMYKEKSPEAMQVFNEVVSRSMITLCRNPTLHKFGLQAFYPKIWDEIAIGYPIALCEAYNADFDGDTAFIQFFTDPLQCAQLQNITPDKMWFYEKSYKSQIVPPAETLYGMYVATKVVEPTKGCFGFSKFEDVEDAYQKTVIAVNDRIIFNDRETSYGRLKIERILGIDLDVLTGGFDQPICSKNIAKLMSALGNHANRVQEFLDLQKFANEIATVVGVGPLPYEELMVGDPKVIKEILSEDEDIYIKKNKVQKYFTDELKKQISELPDHNLEDIQKVAGKAAPSKIINIYAPVVTTDQQGLLVSAQPLYAGVTERDYIAMAGETRAGWMKKQDLVPAGGFNQRQLANLELNLIYKDELGSPDTKGIVLKGEDAVGRTALNGDIITDVVKGNVLVKSCINNPTNIIYKDEIAARDFYNDRLMVGRKYTPTDGSAIGISFASALTETVTQLGLSLKHGATVIDTAQTIMKAIEPGEIVDITDRFVIVQGNHKYSYLRTACTILYSDITVGAFIKQDQPIMKHNRRVAFAGERALSVFNTMTKTKVVDQNLAGYLETSTAVYNLNAGLLEYKNGKLNIGPIEYEIVENDMYFYPIGYTFTEKFKMMSDGTPDMNKIYNMTDRNVQDTYYIFFYHLKGIGAFSTFNSEPFESLFKCLYKSDFSVETGIMQKEEFIDKLYYGNTKQVTKDAIAQAETVTINGKTETSIGLKDGVILAMILGNKYNKVGN